MMRALHVTSEAFPLAKTGGLADVTAALASALTDLDVDVRLLLPSYPQAIEQSIKPQEFARFDGLLGCGKVRLLTALLPRSLVPVWLVDCPQLYNRTGGLYQDAAGEEWRDNALRFALLNHVAAAISTGAAELQWRPDIVHAHDWHAGLLPLLLSRCPDPQPPTVLTVHNLAYQGAFPVEHFRDLGLSDDPRVYSALEFFGRLSFLKSGISSATALTTVSPTYAREILTPEYGCGLDQLLSGRSKNLTGIMNGADYRNWDPTHDPYLVQNFTSHCVTGKRICKTAIQAEMGLRVSIDAPLVAFSSRLAHQKMPDVVLDALPALLADGAQFALVGEGDPVYEAQFRELAAKYPTQVSVHIGYQEPLAHRLLAGADVLLHPSRFEPCGLTPIYAMRYGTLPVVRRTGGTTDSIVDVNDQTFRCEAATGFAFDDPTADALTGCVLRALSLYREPFKWRKVQFRAMQRDFGWKHPARAYLDLYRSLVGESMESDAVQQASDGGRIVIREDIGIGPCQLKERYPMGARQSRSGNAALRQDIEERAYAIEE